MTAREHAEKVRWALHTSATSRDEHYAALDALLADAVRAEEERDFHAESNRLNAEALLAEEDAHDATKARAVRAEEQRDTLRAALSHAPTPEFVQDDYRNRMSYPAQAYRTWYDGVRAAALSSSEGREDTPTHSLHPTHHCLTCGTADGPGPGCVNCRGTGFDQTPCLACASAPGEEQNR